MSQTPSYKCTIIGDFGAGKTSLLTRIAYGTFETHYKAKIGVDFAYKKFNVHNKEIKLQIWDSPSGGQRWMAGPPFHYRGAAGIFLVYNITNRETFVNLPRWLEEARKYVDIQAPVIVIGTNIDKEDRRQVVYEEGEEFAKKNEFQFFEVSAKTCENVEMAFLKMAEMINERIEFKVISYKCVLMGDKGVGKSNLMDQALNRNVKNKAKKNIPGQIYWKGFDINGKNIKLEIFDTAVQGGFRQSVSDYYYCDVFGALLVYDITNRESFVKIVKWLDEAREKYGSEVSIILVGNKADMKSKRVVSYEEGEEFAKENGLRFFETSNKKEHNVEEVFLKMAELLNKKVEEDRIHRNNQRLGLKLQDKNQISPSGNCAC